jgi:hypothetical protein
LRTEHDSGESSTPSPAANSKELTQPRRYLFIPKLQFCFQTSWKTRRGLAYSEIKSGKVKPTDGDEFFENLRQREDEILNNRRK